MADADELLEQWLKAGQDLLASRKGSEREAQLEERIKTIEARFEEEPKTEREEALETLTDDEWALIEAHRAGTPPAVETEPAPVEAPEPEKKMRPGRKSGKPYHFVTDEKGHVQAVDIPTIYSGPDEPGEVALPDKPVAA